MPLNIVHKVEFDANGKACFSGMITSLRVSENIAAICKIQFVKLYLQNWIVIFVSLIYPLMFEHLNLETLGANAAFPNISEKWRPQWT